MVGVWKLRCRVHGRAGTSGREGHAGDARSQGLVPERTIGLAAGTKIRKLELQVPALAPPDASEISLLGGGFCPYAVERHWQLLSGDKRFIRVRICILIRLLLLLLPQT